MANLPFDFDRPEDSLGFLLWQTTITWQKKIKKALEAYNISHAQFVIMATIMWFEAHDYDTTQTLIVNWTKLDKMTVSKALKSLIALGFINRSEHEKDTRAKKSTLTDEGKALIRKLVPIVERIDNSFFGKASPSDQHSLIRILHKLAVDVHD